MPVGICDQIRSTGEDAARKDRGPQVLTEKEGKAIQAPLLSLFPGSLPGAGAGGKR